MIRVLFILSILCHTKGRADASYRGGYVQFMLPVTTNRNFYDTVLSSQRYEPV